MRAIGYIHPSVVERLDKQRDQVIRLCAFTHNISAERNESQTLAIHVDEATTWQERLRAEHAELGARHDALHEFIGDSASPNPAFLALPEEDQVLLLRQYEVMGDYHTILCARIGRITP